MDSGLECMILKEEVVGRGIFGLVGLYLKGIFRGKLFIVVRN